MYIHIDTHTQFFNFFPNLWGKNPSYVHAFILTTPTIKKQALKLIPFIPRLICLL